MHLFNDEGIRHLIFLFVNYEAVYEGIYDARYNICT